MKLTIEINDEALRNAVQSQVGIEVAKLSREAIQAMAQPIIDKVIQREIGDSISMIDRKVNDAVRLSVEAALCGAYGVSSYQRTSKFKEVVEAAAVRLLKESLK